ncbi:uncharacterized protein LOC129738564 [Uranotaenia lowii]|uniref:uncharacterized protein LOC129738564 n=1 Tax=Uranotaenia lowii TaxID=190385 RepID=UPI00247A0FB7|nr:uncharacterized protein LOC129738564 [Uranotaenia lowii]
MNPVSLYITTSRLVFQSEGGGVGSFIGNDSGPGGSANGGGPGTGPGTGGSQGSSNNSNSAFADLNRLLPYLRKSLSCAVCCRLLLEPHTPAELNCQHHVCRGCVGERKKLKPSCASCKDYNRYVENTQLRMLLQCYKSICEYIKTKPFFVEIRKQAGLSTPTATSVNGMSSGSTNLHHQHQQQTPSVPPNNLWELIEEGSRFQDNYRCSSGLTKSAYSILPCIYPVPSVPISNSCSNSSSSGSSAVLSSSMTSAGHHGSSQQQIPIGTGGQLLPTSKVIAEKQQQSQIMVHSGQATSHLHQHHQQQQQHHQQHHHLQQQQQQHQNQHQNQHQPTQKEIKFRSAPIKTVSNGTTMYSVLYAGNGNKITIKRKTDPPHVQRRATIHSLDPKTLQDGSSSGSTVANSSSAGTNLTGSGSSTVVSGFKMPQTTTVKIATVGTSLAGSTMATGQGPGSALVATGKQSAKQLLKRRGCRCGNATATPGKLTCCGQRCPCYVDSKSCIDCKCRGCRNPHRADGMKVRPHIPELQNLEINLPNPANEESLNTATTTIHLGSGSSTSATAGGSSVSGTSSSVAGSAGSGGGTSVASGMNILQQPAAGLSSLGQPNSSGLTISTGAGGTTMVSSGGTTKALLGSQISYGGAPGSTLKITPTSLANVLNNSASQLMSTGDGIELATNAPGLLDASGFSYLTPANLEAAAAAASTGGGISSTTSIPAGTATTQYTTVSGTSMANGTIHVVGVYATHLGDITCSPTLSNMIRTDSGLSSLLTHKPPDALLTQSSLNTLNLSAPSSLLGHSLFNPSTTMTGGSMIPAGAILGGGSTPSAVVGGSGELSMGDPGAGIDISDQLDLSGTNLITIDGASIDGDDV